MNRFEMKQLAYQSELKNRALQVLLYLIDRADKEQTCFPAVPTIGRELHISISTVKRAMRELVEAGYVTKESRFREGNRGQTSNLYTLFFPENTEKVKKEETKSFLEKETSQDTIEEMEQDKNPVQQTECTEMVDNETNIINILWSNTGLKQRKFLKYNGRGNLFYEKLLRGKYVYMINILFMKKQWTGEEVRMIPP